MMKMSQPFIVSDYRRVEPWWIVLPAHAGGLEAADVGAIARMSWAGRLSAAHKTARECFRDGGVWAVEAVAGMRRWSVPQFDIVLELTSRG